MNTADERRFKAYEDIAYIKWNLLTLLQIAKTQRFSKNEIDVIKKKIENVIMIITDFLTTSESKTKFEKFENVDNAFFEIEKITEIFRNNEFPSPEISRIHQLVWQMYVSYERLLSIKQYRTPIILRLFLEFSLGLSVFVLAPEFASLWYWWLLSSFIIAFLLISLIHIQRWIEHPFWDDIDDVKFEFINNFVKRLNK